MMEKFRPQDATTNPSLVLKAVKEAGDDALLRNALADHAASGTHATDPARPYAPVNDLLCVTLGAQITKLIPGRVSTEVDATLSFDTEATIQKARRLIALYEAKGVSRDRVYIKIAATWEGIQACKVLEAEGIRCNMTLVFSFAQAVACGEVGASLISPFVGRVLDWFKAKNGDIYTAETVRLLYIYVYMYTLVEGKPITIMVCSLHLIFFFFFSIYPHLAGPGRGLREQSIRVLQEAQHSHHRYGRVLPQRRRNPSDRRV